MSYLDNYLEASHLKKVHAFNKRMVNLFIMMYGYNLPISEDGPHLCDKNEVAVTPAKEIELTKEEATRHSNFHQNVHDVSHLA